MKRREFVGGLGCLALTRAAWAATGNDRAFAMVAAVDRARVMRAANAYLNEKPLTITAFRSERSPGGAHDFFSESDYFWPDPKNPAGPYKERDGESNPSNFVDHRKAMIRLSQMAPALAAAWRLTKDVRYSRAAAAHLTAWFVAPETRMTPNLEFAQAVRQGVTGRSYGIIDTLHLVEVARAVRVLERGGGLHEAAAVKRWFGEYVAWMRTSVKGMKERDATNNHAVCWALQVSEFAQLCGDEAAMREVRSLFEANLKPQMAADGSFPRELARTKPYGYSIFNFDMLTTLTWSLGGGASKMFAETDGEGRSVCRAAEFLYPYLKDKSSWPYRHDVQHWESWPVRAPGLLWCGLACARPEYVALWKQLDPDPKDTEVVRNFPVRQPLLWV